MTDPIQADDGKTSEVVERDGQTPATDAMDDAEAKDKPNHEETEAPTATKTGPTAKDSVTPDPPGIVAPKTEVPALDNAPPTVATPDVVPTPDVVATAEVVAAPDVVPGAEVVPGTEVVPATEVVPDTTVTDALAAAAASSTVMTDAIAAAAAAAVASGASEDFAATAAAAAALDDTTAAVAAAALETTTAAAAAVALETTTAAAAANAVLGSPVSSEGKTETGESTGRRNDQRRKRYRETDETEHESHLRTRRLKDRQRYASMSADQRKVYNAKRREQYHRQNEQSRKKRREREKARYHSLDSSAAKERNARRAKLERERYQKLSAQELEERNRKRRERAAALRNRQKDEIIAATKGMVVDSGDAQPVIKNEPREAAGQTLDGSWQATNEIASIDPPAVPVSEQQELPPNEGAGEQASSGEDVAQTDGVTEV